MPASQWATVLRRLAGPLLSALLLCLALWALHGLSNGVHLREVVDYMHALPAWQVALATLLTGAGYGAMTLYDWYGLASIGRQLPRKQVGLISFISYAFSNVLGMALLISGSIRYRFYIQAGLSPAEIARVVLYCTASFWLGLAALAGVTLLLVPLPAALPLASLRLPLAIVLTLVPLVWVLLGFALRRPFKLWRWQLKVPTPGAALRQVSIGALDWGLAAAVLYLLMPNEVNSGFGHFLAVFALAQMAGLISHVPGGLGVFEAVMLAGFGAAGNEGLEAPILGALAAYRVIYYLLPLCAATAMVGVRELRELGGKRHLAPWFSGLLPPFFAGLTMVCGALLLFSGVTAGPPGRTDLMRDVLPLPVLEISHFLSSVIGMSLLILARGLQRRLDAAYVLTLILLVLGAVLSLFKGIVYGEALLLGLLALALAPAHRHFYRRASLFSTTFSLGWVVAILAVLGCTAWLVIFSLKHVEYSNSLWWEFSFSHGSAPRALRAWVGAAAVGLLFALGKLIRPARSRPRPPTEADLQRALPLIKRFPSTQAHLALLGDKTLLFDAQDRAFVMYDVEGRSWVAMGDPVGDDEDARRELVWQFREMCEQAGGWPMFYQVRPQDLDLYLDMGMHLLKLGEEARVRLAEFNLDGKSRKTLRNTVNKLARDGLRLEILPPEAVPAMLPRLRTISDAWLQDKKAREKGFSMGSFEPSYLGRTPLAVVWQDDRLLAFANLWLSESMEEASVDLMRFLPDGPAGLMDYLFIELMQWAREQGYRWFNLGMAPLSGLQNRRLAPLWSRFGAMVFGRGERFYNFQGLRRYKDKFDPEWESRYLAVSGGIALPLALTNVASLISGGLSGVVRR